MGGRAPHRRSPWIAAGQRHAACRGRVAVRARRVAEDLFGKELAVDPHLHASGNGQRKRRAASAAPTVPRPPGHEGRRPHTERPGHRCLQSEQVHGTTTPPGVGAAHGGYGGRIPRAGRWTAGSRRLPPRAIPSQVLTGHTAGGGGAVNDQGPSPPAEPVRYGGTPDVLAAPTRQLAEGKTLVLGVAPERQDTLELRPGSTPAAKLSSSSAAGHTQLREPITTGGASRSSAS